MKIFTPTLKGLTDQIGDFHLTGSLKPSTGTLNVTASYAITASYAMNGGGGGSGHLS